MCTLTVLRMSLTLQCCFSMSTSWLLLNEDIQWSVHEMFLYPAEQNKTRNQVLLDDAPVNCSVVLLDPFFTYFIICTYPCWAGGGDPYSNQGPEDWGSHTQIVKCPEAFWFVIFGLTNQMGLTSNPLPQQSGCYEDSAHLNISPFQLQHQTSAPQHKNNRLCYCYIAEKCV